MRMRNLNMLLDDVTLKSAETLSISLQLPEGIDVLKMKDIIKKDIERQLQNLSNISHNNILKKKFIYEVSEIYPISNIVLVKRVDIDVNNDLALKEKQFIVNN